MNPPDILAAGAVLWRQGPLQTEVALVHRPKYDDWTFPKGKLKNGEHLLRAAAREVYEETGISPKLGRQLPSTFYEKNGADKRVDYWAAEPEPHQHADGLGGDEVDAVEWLTVTDAARRLSYQRDVDLLRAFTSGPTKTVPIILVRHAKAVGQSEWPDADMLRPLDLRGRSQAAELAGLLACFGPATVYSSATARCLETLLPYVNGEGLSIKTEAAFTPDTAKPGQATQRLCELIGLRTPTIVCGHSDQITDMVNAACQAFGAQPPDDPTLRKAAFWVLHPAGSRIVAVDQYQTQS
ncbi:MAG TPA: NUDIX hydrolase [Stackebrandtia sp.]|jgi:8-oxo-dGTP diphosphatase|uniref:NUDIX hydrolase n=1 Tax=Stackebrandtia sp. TaxID=2023065 RepID=UPI002D5616B8|nr:NUDIX hydrolase [Stackebrandtia sp.]HZE38472.1 NUDIX hydrolase [Stackebrandtia sp.]